MSLRTWWLVVVCLGLVGCASDVNDPGAGCDDASEVCDVFRLVNEERASAGVPPYAWNGQLGDAAQLHAEDMVAQNYFDHASLDGRSFSDRAVEAGYDASPRGENIAAGQRNPASVMDSWMNSDGHRRNILSDGSNEIGIGLHERHWVQVFGFRRAAPMD